MQAYRKDGNVVQPGETIISFRGEKWTLVRVTGMRALLARRGDWEQELYPTVFDLEIK